MTNATKNELSFGNFLTMDFYLSVLVKSAYDPVSDLSVLVAPEDFYW